LKLGKSLKTEFVNIEGYQGCYSFMGENNKIPSAEKINTYKSPGSCCKISLVERIINTGPLPNAEFKIIPRIINIIFYSGLIPATALGHL
jgi:hypothetical protein